MLLGGISYTFGSTIQFRNENGQKFIATVTDFYRLPPRKGRARGKPGFLAVCKNGQEMWGYDDWITEIIEK